MMAAIEKESFRQIWLPAGDHGRFGMTTANFRVQIHGIFIIRLSFSISGG